VYRSEEQGVVIKHLHKLLESEIAHVENEYDLELISLKIKGEVGEPKKVQLDFCAKYYNNQKP
jgi:hypothetical protein